MAVGLLSSTEVRLLVALALGLLVGIERERRMSEQGEQEPAGMRTFGLVALLGAVLTAYLSPVGVALGGLFVGSAAIVGYLRTATKDRGVTTEVAMVLVYVLGGLAIRRPDLAAGLSMLTALVLAERRRLHALATETLSHDELHDLMLLGVAALVVLPIVPNRPLGPFGGINPFTVWRLVVVVMALSALGYVGQRVAGPKYGLPLAGLASGFVSSTATVASMGAHAQKKPSLETAAIAGASASGIATVIQLWVVVFAASPSAAMRLMPAIVSSLVAAVGYALLWARTAARADEESTRSRVVNVKAALVFAVLIASVTMVARALHHRYGAQGLFVVAAVVALVDAHAAAGSVAAAFAAGGTSPSAATTAILVAFTVNALSKVVVSFVSGSRRFATRVSFGVLVAVAAGWGARAFVA